MNRSDVIIAVDFDGTIVTHEYPKIGQLVPYAKDVLLKIQDYDYKIILYTMRSNKELSDAVQFIENLGIRLYGINQNPTQKEWTTSPKVYANYYIDDAAIGCPMTYPENGKRPYVDWMRINTMLFPIDQMRPIEFSIK